MKYTFILKGIDVDALNIKYELNISSNLVNPPKEKTDITNITDLSIPDTKHFSYLDEAKREHTCLVSMISVLARERLPNSIDINCFWCRNKFETMPIGCPLAFVNSQITKKYYSEITKDNYTIRENVSQSKIDEVNERDKNDVRDFSIEPRDHYEVDGIFCSFNCCLSFIRDYEHDPKYMDSETLLTSIYRNTFNTQKSILPAPSWKITYGLWWDHEYRRLPKKL